MSLKGKIVAILAEQDFGDSEFSKEETKCEHSVV